MAQIEIRNLRKSFKDAAVLRGVSLNVDKGEIVALFGPSGTGKTVLLRLLAGIYAPDAGTIGLRGRDASGSPPEKRGIGMAFQNFALFPHMTARDNIASALTARKADAAEIGRKVDAVARLLKIGHVLDHSPRELSNGQKQRTALARALVRDADLYVLDEPMGQLEPQLRAVLRGRLKRLLKDRAMTSIFVTHDQTEANALADRIAVMESGVLQQFANQHDLKERPANLYVATFIGEPPMNVFDAAVVRTDDRTTFELDHGPSFGFGDNELGPEVRQAIGNRRRIVIGIRPHRIALGGGCGETARVVSNQWLGDQSHVAMAVAGKLMVAVSHVRVRATVGESVPYGVRAQDLHLFDPETTLALAHGVRAA